jgi:Nucleotidyltransferase domain
MKQRNPSKRRLPSLPSHVLDSRHFPTYYWERISDLHEMAIPESQLDTWSHQGATTTASATHLSIRTALTAGVSALQGKVKDGNVEIYLQGSYKNDTNIRGDSDVDVVIQLNSTFGRDLSALPPNQKAFYETAFGQATYPWTDFRADVLRALRSYYGQDKVMEGKKSLKLAAGGGRLAADVVPVLHFRKYQYFYSHQMQSYLDGVEFFSRPDNQAIINFPRAHYDNGVTKNSGGKTDGWYKPTVRVFKNARTYLADRGDIVEDLAPSYFLECLLYNVPDQKFGASFQDTFVKLWNWLSSEAPVAQLRCQNDQLPLFGNSPEQWDTARAYKLLQALKNLWENW